MLPDAPAHAPSPLDAASGEASIADVVLVLEGTYPYAVGGVSTWVHALVKANPDLAFGVVHLFAGQSPGTRPFERLRNIVWQLDLRLPDRLEAVDAEALAARVPAARVVHALATGFAGLVGQAICARTGAPLLLTEHGIYWHEIEQGALELECGLRLHGQDLSGGNACASRARWVDTFQSIARTTYADADVITTVCEANADLQRALGARDPVVIPNGVPPPETRALLDASEVAGLHPSAALPATVRIGLVGRVTPIKDVHAFVRAAAQVAASVPGARFYVVGPTDDADYAASVEALAARRGVRLHLTGRQPAALWHRHLDVVALTSRSEAEPLALLEAMAHGTPVVAPDIGGCRALIEGGEEAPGGLVVTVPDATGGLPDIAPGGAEAITRIVTDSALAARLGAAGARRAAGRSSASVAERYRALYARLAAERGVEGERRLPPRRTLQSDG